MPGCLTAAARNHRAPPERHGRASSTLCHGNGGKDLAIPLQAHHELSERGRGSYLVDELDRWCAGSTHVLSSRTEIEFRKSAFARARLLRGSKQVHGEARNDGSLWLVASVDGHGHGEWRIDDGAVLEAIGKALAEGRSLLAPAIAGTPDAIVLLSADGSFKGAIDQWEMQRSTPPGKS